MADGGRALKQHARPSTKTLTIHRYAYKKSSPYAILKSFADDLKLLPIGPRTEQAYWACLRQLGEHYQKSPDQISAEEFRQYCIYLKTQKKVARQTSTQVLCAFKLFWEKTLRRPWPHEIELVRANPQFKLPVVLSASEVRRILQKVALPDQRVALITIYSCGLRLGEGLSLEVKDIDSQRMLLHIRAGKGNADHYVPLPQRTLELWKQRWVTHSQHAGSGTKALEYLSRYIFKTATGDRPLVQRPDGQLLWPYRDSATGQRRTLALSPTELIRRFLQHVLLRGYTRVRCFGFFHPAAKVKLNRVRALLRQKPLLNQAEHETWHTPQQWPEPKEEPSSQPDNSSPPCPRCGVPMRWLARWRAGQHLPRPPPQPPPAPP